MYSPPLVSKTERVAIVLKVGVAECYSQDFYHKWTHLRSSSKKRDAVCLLSFAEYMRLVKRADITQPDQIGKAAGAYQMGRNGDKGDYEMGNCRFITVEQNQREQTLNGGRAAGTAKRAKSLRGRNRETHDYVARQALQVSKRFTLISPKGRIYHGVGLRNFVREHNLTESQYTRLGLLLRGKIKSLHGWKGKYEEE